MGQQDTCGPLVAVVVAVVVWGEWGGESCFRSRIKRTTETHTPLPKSHVNIPPTHTVRTCNSPPGPSALSKSVRPTLGSTADSGSSSSCTAARL